MLFVVPTITQLKVRTDFYKRQMFCRAVGSVKGFNAMEIVFSTCAQILSVHR